MRPPTPRRLQGAILPLGHHNWLTIGRPGGYRHITLEEADAFVWHLEERILRGQLAVRGVHVGDNAAQVGAHAKGRSPTRRMNHRCRRVAALQLAADILILEVWERSKFNPADEPSSRYGVRADRRVSAWQSHAPGAERSPPLPLLSVQDRCPIFLHLFSGPRREGDLQHWLDTLAAEADMALLVLSVDMCIRQDFGHSQ